jgi:lipopolysaccharide export system protein LptC
MDPNRRLSRPVRIVLNVLLVIVVALAYWLLYERRANLIEESEGVKTEQEGATVEAR